MNRNEFEQAMAKAATDKGFPTEPADLAALRVDNTYGDGRRRFLNGAWVGWQLAMAVLEAVRTGGRETATARSCRLRYDMEAAPAGVKLQLLTPGGILVFGTLTTGNRGQYWAWAPLPQRDKDEEKRRGL